jgi:hypothetical protein
MSAIITVHFYAQDSYRSALIGLSFFLIYINNTIDPLDRKREIQSHDKIISVLSLAIVRQKSRKRG